MKKLMVILSVLILVTAFCSKNGDTAKEEFVPLNTEQVMALLEKVKNTPATPVEENEIAVIETELGTIKLKFYPDVAPNHCANFKRLAVSGYYDNTTFHRTVRDFMIQGGDINSKDNIKGNEGMGGPGYTIDAEFNDRPHKRGALSMARKPSPNSAGSQFFICHGSVPTLDGQYTVFGEVIEGMDVVDKIATAPVQPGTDRPQKPVRILKVTMVKN